MIRLPGCNGGGETTVLAHYRDSSTGMGKKEPDFIGAWACNRCHDIVDGRKEPPNEPFWTSKDARLAHLEGIVRTQQQLIREGVIK